MKWMCSVQPKESSVKAIFHYVDRKDVPKGNIQVENDRILLTTKDSMATANSVGHAKKAVQTLTK